MKQWQESLIGCNVIFFYNIHALYYFHILWRQSGLVAAVDTLVETSQRGIGSVDRQSELCGMQNHTAHC